MYKFLIFDWDGTLINSADGIVQCMQQAASDLNFPVPDDAAIRNIIGLGLPEALQLLIPDIDGTGIEQMRQCYGHHYVEQGDAMASLFPGVEESLERFKSEGYTLAVATGKSRKGLDRVFQKTGIGHFFTHSRCADETRSKPHPQMLDELLLTCGIPRGESLMIGDTEYDLEMAARARVPSLGVTYGSHTPERLQQHSPVHMIHEFVELEPWLNDQR